MGCSTGVLPVHSTVNCHRVVAFVRDLLAIKEPFPYALEAWEGSGHNA